MYDPNRTTPTTFTMALPEDHVLLYFRTIQCRTDEKDYFPTRIKDVTLTVHQDDMSSMRFFGDEFPSFRPGIDIQLYPVNYADLRFPYPASAMRGFGWLGTILAEPHVEYASEFNHPYIVFPTVAMKEKYPSFSNCYIYNLVKDPPMAVEGSIGSLQEPNMPTLVGSLHVNRGPLVVPKTHSVGGGTIIAQKSQDSRELLPEGATAETITIRASKYVATAIEDEHWTIEGVKLGPKGVHGLFIGGTPISVGSHGALIVDGTTVVESLQQNTNSATTPTSAKPTEWHVTTLDIGGSSQYRKKLDKNGKPQGMDDMAQVRNPVDLEGIQKLGSNSGKESGDSEIARKPPKKSGSAHRGNCALLFCITCFVFVILTTSRF
jgi:hypothetical protein